ncbi:MAG: hypothetical protein ACK40T_10625 [Akkermansiaceae bacterium]|jgi:DNA-directed RNA polymerase delta subunit
MKTFLLLILLFITACSLSKESKTHNGIYRNNDKTKRLILKNSIFEIYKYLDNEDYNAITNSYIYEKLVYDGSFVIEDKNKSNVIKFYFGDKIKTKNQSEIYTDRKSLLLKCKVNVHQNCAILTDDSNHMEIKLIYSNQSQKWQISMLNTFHLHDTLDPSQW